MKYVLRALIGVIVLGVVLVGGVVVYGTYWYKYDFKAPQVAASFKEKYNQNCLALYKKRATKNGQTVGDDQLDKLDQACSCVRDGMVDALAKRPALTGSEVADLMQNDPELKSVSQSCSTKFGIQEPL